MLRSTLIGLTAVGLLFTKGLGCAPDSPRIPNPTRADAPVTRAPAPTNPSPTAPTDASPVPGAAGCGFASAAFCETFSTRSSRGGRTGDLDPARWSVSRAVGNDNGNIGATELMPFGATPVSPCKSGVLNATADSDLLVCDGASGHQGQLLTAMSAQNYALLSMRPRQPFDFAGRTGTIAYNVDTVTQGLLSWWTSLYVTDQPDSAASDGAEVFGMLPHNGVGVNFDSTCSTTGSTKAGIGNLFVYSNYVETRIGNDTNPVCISTQRGSLNHIEIRLSQSKIEVWASDYSTDNGRTFPNLRQIFSSGISLSFSRGYVHFQQAERAPVKYQSTPQYANNYWSNVGFDGPVVAFGERGYSFADALTRNPNTGASNIGYGLLTNPYSMFSCCSGINQTSVSALSVGNVSTAGVTKVKLSFIVYYVYTGSFQPNTVALHYRINNSGWLDPSVQPNYAAEDYCETSKCPGPTGGGGVLYTFDVDKSLIAAGTNTVAFGVDNSENGYPPIVSSVDLLTFTG